MHITLRAFLSLFAFVLKVFVLKVFVLKVFSLMFNRDQSWKRYALQQ